jgi:DNA polymerase-3 subunit epsilon
VEERSSQDKDLVAFHLVDNWRYIAKLALAEDIYDHGLQLAAPAGASTTSTPSPLRSDGNFDLDIYFILIRFLLDPDKLQLNNLRLWPLERCQ